MPAWYINIVYRVFDSTSNTFKFSRSRLKIDDNDYWLMHWRGNAYNSLLFKQDNFDYYAKISIKTPGQYSDDNTIINVKSELKKWFGKFNIFGLYKHEYYNNKQDFQFKVGVGIKL